MAFSANADEASRKAEANAMIARVEANDFKLEQLDRGKEIMKMKGKADSMIRKTSYNDQMATAVVMGAASGRVLGEGSAGAIYDKSAEDFRWEQMWNDNNLDISLASIEADKTNILKGNKTSLMLGAEALNISRQRSYAGQSNTANLTQSMLDQSHNRMVTGLGQAGVGALGAFGSEGLEDLMSSNRANTSLFENVGVNLKSGLNSNDLY